MGNVGLRGCLAVAVFSPPLALQNDAGLWDDLFHGRATLPTGRWSLFRFRGDSLNLVVTIGACAFIFEDRHGLALRDGHW